MTTQRGQLKQIAPVPTASDFLDIVLSKTQRKLPTVIRSGFKISRIRSFYMRKVSFAQGAFHEKLDAILGDFPVLDNLHPFMSSLLNVLYDRQHYKLALGQLNTARHLIDNVGKDYARLLKFGDSLYRCKQLKKAALGRMATIIKRQKDPLAYLEQVRQHMSRLPAIDPTTRTLLVCGYPNVGKSSFVNKLSRADVDVQPYAFTTKSLFVGHFDYKYLRWQVIDTPGVLDHPLDEMNTIEMQSITALAHLRASIMYFVDLSEQCGYSLEAQCQLFHSIKPLFAGKPTFIVVNKIDVVRPEDLDPERRALLDSLLGGEGGAGATLLQLSCHSEEGVMAVREAACDSLLAHRVETKERTKRVDAVAHRIRVAVPAPRDEVERKPFIPAAVLEKRKYDKADPDRIRTELDLELESGGAGVYSSDLRKGWMLKDDDWKYDVVPEFVDGKNLADFIDPDIAARLDELEAEEERLEAEGFYDSDEEVGSDVEVLRETVEAIRTRKGDIKRVSQAKKQRAQNHAPVPRTQQKRSLSAMTSALREAGHDPSLVEARANAILDARRESVGSKRKRGGEDGMDLDDEDDLPAAGDDWDSDDDDAMQVDGAPRKRARTGKGATSIVPRGKRVPAKSRLTAGLRDGQQLSKSMQLDRLGRRERNRNARAGDADRHVPATKPKHLFSGKRKGGKHDRR